MTAATVRNSVAHISKLGSTAIGLRLEHHLGAGCPNPYDVASIPPPGRRDRGALPDREEHDQRRRRPASGMDNSVSAVDG